jgi:hypothetical protein
MSGELADLVRDAASLHQFIGSIYKRRDEPEWTHRQATIVFLEYIRALGEKSQTFLQSFVQRIGDAPADPELARFEQQRLSTIRDFWRSLHELVRPVEDAHTLSIPVALIEFLKGRLSAIRGLEGCEIVTSHTTELNYFFHTRANFRSRVQEYEAIVEGLPALGMKPALIAMPYSQGTSLFLNLVICHELGHFAFEELGLERELSRHIDDALRDAVVGYETMAEPDPTWCRERLKYWSEEIYCDRFAIGLIGPAYSFAFIELFDIIGTSDADGVGEFYDTHPGYACRFKEHADQLSDGNWWSLLEENARTSYVELIKKLAAIPETSYVYTSEEKSELAEPVLAAFLKLKPRIATLVADTLGDQIRPFRGVLDREEIDLIRIYLGQGVVPSTLVQGGREKTPDAVAVINAAYLFYLEKLPELMKKIAGQGETNLSHRSKWAERVEMWTLKALDDLSLLSYRKEAVSGSPIEKSNP